VAPPKTSSGRGPWILSLADRSSTELEGSAHVVDGQLRVVSDDVLERLALSDESDHRRDRNTSATKARHTAHDAVVGDDAGLGHGFSVGPWPAQAGARTRS
jgi:hypothetical protein